MLRSARAEPQRRPLTAAFGGLSALCSVVSTALALYVGGPGSVAPPPSPSANGSGYIICLAAGVSAASTRALLARLIQGTSRASAYFASMLPAAGSITLSAPLFRVEDVHLRSLSDGSPSTAAAPYWSTTLAFLAIGAEKVFDDFIAPERARFDPSADAGEQAKGSLAVLAVMTAVWLAALWAGQNATTGTLIDGWDQRLRRPPGREQDLRNGRRRAADLRAGPTRDR